jgi:hypothetical protein
MIVIFARETWYRSRPETEQEWLGVLRKRDAPISPAGRTALRYSLITDSETLPVYVANSEWQFAEYADVPIRLRGKLVDLGSEGFGRELWVGSIEVVAA